MPLARLILAMLDGFTLGWNYRQDEDRFRSDMAVAGLAVEAFLASSRASLSAFATGIWPTAGRSLADDQVRRARAPWSLAASVPLSDGRYPLRHRSAAQTDANRPREALSAAS